jgi:hypothetical protein
LRLIVRTLAARDFVDLVIAIVVNAVTNFVARNDIRLAIPQQSTNAALKPRFTIRDIKRSWRTTITSWWRLTFCALTIVIHFAIAVVVKNVVAIFEVRELFTRANAPHTVGTNLDTRNAYADISRPRRAAITILHLRIHARAAFVNQPVTVVVNAVANLVGRRRHRRTRLRQSIHTRWQYDLARTHPAYKRRQIGGIAWIVCRFGINPQERRTTHDRERCDQETK